MKHTIAILSAAAVASAVRPVFLNSEYNVVEGEPFTLTFSGCDSGCTITIESGADEESMKPVQELTADATGGEATVTVENLPSDEYAFRITDNETEEYNFSGSFDYEGTGDAPATTTSAEVTSTTEAPETTTEATTEAETTTEEETSTTEEATTTEEETTTSTPETSSFTTTTSSEAETTTEATTTIEEDQETTTSEEEAPETTVPDGAAGSLGRPMALVLGAVAAMLLLN